MTMTNIQIVALYAGINLIILPILMFRVGQVRNSTKTSLGNGEDFQLLSRIRAHGNFAETTPFALLGLLVISMLAGVPAWLMHVFGGGFTLGRILHAHGMAKANALGKGRIVGTLLSVLTFFVMGGYLIFRAFTG